MCNVGAWCQEVPSVHRLVYTCTQGNSWDDGLVLAVRTDRNLWPQHCLNQPGNQGSHHHVSCDHSLLLPGGQVLQHYFAVMLQSPDCVYRLGQSITSHWSWTSPQLRHNAPVSGDHKEDVTSILSHFSLACSTAGCCSGVRWCRMTIKE